MCTTQWCLCFSVLDLVKRLLTKVVRMSTAKGPQPNSTSAADRNKVTKFLAWMKSTFQCPGTHSQGSPNNSSRCPNDSPRGTFQYLTLTDIFKLFASRWPRALDLMWRTLQQTSPRFSPGNIICYTSIDTIASGDLAAVGFELGQYWKRESQQVRQSSSKADQSAIYESLWIWLIRRRYIKLVKILFQ